MSVTTQNKTVCVGVCQQWHTVYLGCPARPLFKKYHSADLWRCRQNKNEFAYQEINNCEWLSQWEVCVTSAESSLLQPASDPAAAVMSLAHDLLWATLPYPPSCLLFCQQHLLGLITGLDQPPVGLLELAWIS